MNKRHIPQTERPLAYFHMLHSQAAESPWLAALLFKRAQRLQQRLAHFYQEVRNLPRRWRRKLQKLFAAGLVGAALMLAFGPTPSVHAATIAVDPAGAGTGIAADSNCSLVEAIINANNGGATYGDCDPGSGGADTITLNGGTYTYITNYGTSSALPNITSQITIEGNGATIERDAGAPNFRIIRVSISGDLTLNDATITGGNTTKGGGIYNLDGTLTLNSSTVTGNNASIGGGIYNFDASTTLNNSTVSSNTANSGGGISNDGTYSATVTLNNSTVTGNTAGIYGGGIYNLYFFSYVNLNRSIVSGNTSALAGEEVYNVVGGIGVNNYNVMGDDAKTTAQAFYGFSLGPNDFNATSDSVDATPLASILNTTLADNGGPTFTHALVGGSPAIDSISTTNPNCNPGSSVDQRGAARANGVDQGGGACDSGAYEVSAETPTAITLQNMTTTPQAAQTGLITALLAGLSTVSLALYRRFKSTA